MVIKPTADSSIGVRREEKAAIETQFRLQGARGRVAALGIDLTIVPQVPVPITTSTLSRGQLDSARR